MNARGEVTGGGGKTVLLFGGTGETVPLAEALVANGHRVVVSMATGQPLQDPLPHGVKRRSGMLDARAMVALFQEESIDRVVDATHPFAVLASRTIREACRMATLPYERYERPADADFGDSAILVASHKAAAKAAVGYARPILLTTGSRNLLPYVEAARAADLPLFARVLPAEESLAACRMAGLLSHEIIAARGPFSVADTETLLRQHAIGTLVTKDSGKRGGLTEKACAADRCGATLIVIQRPEP